VTVTSASASSSFRRLLVEPVPLGSRVLPPIGLVVLAMVGALLLLVVATSRWAYPNDEHAYWLAGQRLLNGLPLYDPTATSITPFAYWYPPILAQVVAPLTLILPSEAFSWAWTGLLLACLWWLAGGRPLWFLAMIAFVPVASELGFRNVHLILAVLIVLGIRGSPAMYSVAAGIKLAPGLGVIYLAAGGKWRAAALASAVGLTILAVSVALSPQAWVDFFGILSSRGPADASALVPIPYWVRAVTGLVLAVIAPRLRPRIGEPLLVLAIVVALPTLWFTALSTLAALVPVIAFRWASADRRTPTPSSVEPRVSDAATA
jgi:Glycosyltransferase family 87